MSLLSGKRIWQAMQSQDESERIVLTPFFDRKIQIKDGAASVDLRLGSRFSVAKKHRLVDTESMRKPIHPRRIVTEYFVPLGGTFVLHPRQFVLGVTLEWLRLPFKYAGYIIGRSSYARRGLIIATATGVHPGFSGPLTLELTNVAEVPLTITPGQSICQLFVHDVLGSDKDKLDVSVHLACMKPLPGEITADRITKYLTRLLKSKT